MSCDDGAKKEGYESKKRAVSGGKEVGMRSEE
jgi:hypothetical protein